MYRCGSVTRASELCMQTLGSLSARQQRAQAFYQHHLSFSTQTPPRRTEAAVDSHQHAQHIPLNVLPSNASNRDDLATGWTPTATMAKENVVLPAVTPEADSTAAQFVRSRAQSRNERKLRRIGAGKYRPAAGAVNEQQTEANQVELLLAKIGRLEPPRAQFIDTVPVKARQGIKDSKAGGKVTSKQAKSDAARDGKLQPKAKRDAWQSQKEALDHKFGEQGWQPRKRLSPDTLDGIRALHASDPAAYSTETLSEHFKVTPEAIRRILKSKWRPSEGETEERRARWQRRGVKKWQEMAESGMRPPVKWRAMGVGGADGPVEERLPKRKKVRRPDDGLSWGEVVGGVRPLEEGFDGSLADRLL